MKTLKNGFETAFAASIATPTGVIFYRSSCCTYHDDAEETANLPDWMNATTFRPQEENAKEALGVPSDAREVGWSAFKKALAACDTDTLSIRAENIRSELGEIERKIAAIDSLKNSNLSDHFAAQTRTAEMAVEINREWRAAADGFAAVIDPSGFRISVGAKSDVRAQAATAVIVRCCNAHAELVAALENCSNLLFAAGSGALNNPENHAMDIAKIHIEASAALAKAGK